MAQKPDSLIVAAVVCGDGDAMVLQRPSQAATFQYRTAVMWSRSHQRLVSVSAIYVSSPRRYFRPNYASHINKMSYAWRPWRRLHVIAPSPCKLALCIIIIINGRENKFTSAIIITCRPVLTSRDLQTSRSWALTSRAHPGRTVTNLVRSEQNPQTENNLPFGLAIQRFIAEIQPLKIKFQNVVSSHS